MSGLGRWVHHVWLGVGESQDVVDDVFCDGGRNVPGEVVAHQDVQAKSIIWQESGLGQKAVQATVMINKLQVTQHWSTHSLR